MIFRRKLPDQIPSGDDRQRIVSTNQSVVATNAWLSAFKKSDIVSVPSISACTRLDHREVLDAAKGLEEKGLIAPLHGKSLLYKVMSPQFPEPPTSGSAGRMAIEYLPPPASLKGHELDMRLDDIIDSFE